MQRQVVLCFLCCPYLLTRYQCDALSYESAPGTEITPCNKIDKPIVVYGFSRNVMTSIATLRTQ